jgi:hypothetical protein
LSVALYILYKQALRQRDEIFEIAALETEALNRICKRNENPKDVCEQLVKEIDQIRKEME